MRQEDPSDFTKGWDNENHPFERQSNMESAEYVFMPEQGMWHGYLKGCPNFEAYGESFEALQLKLNRLHPDPTGSISPSTCSDTALLCWDWQRRISRIP
ncbi:MAG: hypothetical protein KF722_12400 [Nitrospira sp.]|nr:hypothetical protein [Nitrospira sp.]